MRKKSCLVWKNSIEVFCLANHLDKIYVSWALSLNKRVGVSACKQHMPDTHVFVPTLHKLFLLIYWKLKRYEHLTLTTNQLVESSFLCFQNNAFCLKYSVGLHFCVAFKANQENL